MWIAISAVLLMMFLFSVWRLRAQTRQKLGIHGSQFLDCLSSFFCCFCVVSQLYLELKCHDGHPRQQHYQRSQADNTFTSTGPADTLAPYVAM
ncbi:hypothetical protein DD238_001714 [Peronospora effusa]|uniref:Uncharacterized protein n=1 Tax=Peronospora effusa TaxID=542832 RepID=A0A3M6VTK4_9STRA|nr:hypothetical protein DD238_001714 [Peronospora effusa]RQM16776.1 hypothetical protein DD237_000555 [Peronospora effusa]